MTAPKVRTDHQQLKEAAGRFDGQAQAAQQSLQALKGQMEVLQGGDWQGLGATAFYQEMGGQVLPAMKRLAAALEAAHQTTLQIGQLMQQAEDEAARVLRGEGGAGQSALGVAGPTDGAAGGGGVAGAGVAAGPQNAAGANPLADAVAKMVAADNAAVDSKLSMFSQGVRDLVKKSPALRAQIFQMQQDGYSFTTGPVAKGYFTDRDQKTITIDQPQTDEVTVAHIAHEVGHALYKPGYVARAPGMTRDEYVQKNVDAFMQDEAAGQFNAAMIRRDLKIAGGPDIGIPGSQTAAYQRAFDDYVSGKITRPQVMDRMATLMGNERISIPPKSPYRDYYRSAFEKEWDDNAP